MKHIICLIIIKNYRIFKNILNLYQNIGLNNFFKQFLATNCSKERPGSIMTETLKSGILIPIDT